MYLFCFAKSSSFVKNSSNSQRFSLFEMFKSLNLIYIPQSFKIKSKKELN
ncbi:MAG: hypothetical protein LBQ24_07935 [Candidatus Peribacteria bacterium]|nr:hypothetical protein [Candidatus Peribacteria bacterium]